jgi:hypothetical protein
LQNVTATLASEISANSSLISTLTTNLAGANSAIASLQTVVGSNETGLVANITAANLAISSVVANVGTLTSEVNVHTANIAQNTSNIANLQSSVTGITSNVAVLQGDYTSLSTTVNTLYNDLTTGTANLIVGNVEASGYFYANGVQFVGGGITGNRANIGNISFSNYTITTVNDSGGNFGITLNPQGNGKIHLDTLTGINNPNPAYWLEVGNQISSLNTGAMAVDFGNGNNNAPYNGSAIWTWDWKDASGLGPSANTTPHATFALYYDSVYNQPIMSFDANSAANSMVITSNSVSFSQSVQVQGNVSTVNLAVGPNSGNTNLVTGVPLYASLSSYAPSYAGATTDIIARFVGSDTGNATIALNGYNTLGSSGALVEYISARGNSAVGLASIQNGDAIGRLSAKGYGSTKYSSGVAQVSFIADGNFTDTSQPTAIAFYTTAANTTVFRQVGRFANTGNLLLNSGTVSSGVGIGGLVLTGNTGASIGGNVYVGGNVTTYGTLSSGNISAPAVVLTQNIPSTTVSTGGLVVAGGFGLSGNLNMNGRITANGAATFNGQVFVTSTQDPATGSGAIVTTGGATIGGNLLVESQVFIGTNSLSTQLTNSALAAKTSSSSGAGIQYAQASLTNTAGSGSADWIAYGDNYPGPSNDHGWMDLGYTGSTFNDPDFTITKANDGYIFAGAVAGSGLGGNLVIATDNTGTYGDIVFATSSFYANAEVARFHGNLTSGSTFTVQSDILAKGKLVLSAGQAPATSSSTGIAGQVAYDANYVYICVATNTWKRSALSTW